MQHAPEEVAQTLAPRGTDDFFRRAVFSDHAAVEEQGAGATSLAKAISWVTSCIVIPSARGRPSAPAPRPPARIEGRGHLVEQHLLGCHRQGAHDRHALLLPTRELRRVACFFSYRPMRWSSASASATACRRGIRRTRIGASTTFSSTVMCGQRL